MNSILPHGSGFNNRRPAAASRTMTRVDASLAKEVGKLYALPAGEFTAARNARAKKLRAADPDLAAAVAKLPKPTVAAAAVNRLARDQPSEVRELIQAGKRLRAAQERAVAGKGKPDDLQQAIGEHRAALERLQREARRLRLSDAVLERVVRTIRAASLDPEAQRLLERGLLAEELEAAGFALDPGLVVVPKSKRAAATRGGRTREATRAERRKAEERLAAAEEALAAVQEEARQAASDLRSAERAVAAALRKVEKAEADVKQAREGL
jgi:septal ring factor EnvC (AmiA/AmiB activator)